MTAGQQLPGWVQRGGNPDLLATELLETITTAILTHPRTQQVRIGPSEIGQKCSRRIAYKLLNHAEHERAPAWKPAIGTAIHTWLEAVFDHDNMLRAPNMGGQERWYVETTVDVGEVAGQHITGSCDLYDRATATVIDWKTCGPKTLSRYKTHGPGDQYRTQAHLYGRGWARRGLPVDTVMIVFLPRDGELRNTHIWYEPYNEQIAVNALQRLEGIALTVEALGAAALEHTPTTDDYCQFCPFFKSGSTNLAEGCPGDPSRATTTATPFAGILAGE